MTQRTWSGAAGSYTDPTQWSPNGVPGSGDNAIINSGTVTASGFTFTGVAVNLNGATTAAGALILNSDAINSASTLTITDTGTFGGAIAPALTFGGTTTNAGTINFVGTTPGVSFSAGATLVNTGTLAISGSSVQVQTATGATAGSIVNNGSIQVTNPSNAYQSAIINATITGTGTITLGDYAAIAFRQTIASGQSINFDNSSTAGTALEIDAPTSFGGTVSGFVSSDRMILTSIPYTNYTYASTGSSSGTLTLYNGSTVESQINLSGIYSQGTFSVQANALGTSGLNNVIVTTAVTNSLTGATATPAGAVYRFFDTKYGTHFFTSDIGERNTVLASRPDLKEETNGFGDVAQSDPNAVAVYRFFDTTYGTHFFTASSTERDTILATRPDLSYEPSSTFYEHSSQQTGDTAVYRLFDQTTGTQFLTGDQGEYNGITTPGSATYRADLHSEGVAFYAPTGSFT